MNTIYVNNTGSDVSMFHSIIIDAVNNGGSFDEEFADVFMLVKCPVGSACQWALYFYDDLLEKHNI